MKDKNRNDYQDPKIIRFNPDIDRQESFKDDPCGFEIGCDGVSSSYGKTGVSSFVVLCISMIIIALAFIFVIGYGYLFSVNDVRSNTLDVGVVSKVDEINEYIKSYLLSFREGDLSSIDERIDGYLPKDVSIVNESVVEDMSKPISRFESDIYNLCSKYGFTKSSVEELLNVKRSIFYYSDYDVARKVARDIFITADSISHQRVTKVRTDKEKGNTDIYLSDGKSNNFIVSIKFIDNSTIYGKVMGGMPLKNSFPNKMKNVTDLDRMTDFNKKPPESTTDTEYRDNIMTIILDDVGDTREYRDFLRLDFPLTFAVIPLRMYSMDATHEINLFDKYSLIIHAPFDSGTKDSPNVVTFYRKDDDLKIIDKLGKFIADVPFATGLNNHQGSKATSDEAFMDRFMSIYAEKDLYFIDSLTIASSVAYNKARDHGIMALKRDVFLDNKNNYKYIETMFNKCVKKLSKKDYVIAIGHVTKNQTYKYLSRILENTNKQGIHFYNTDDLIQLVYPYQSEHYAN